MVLTLFLSFPQHKQFGIIRVSAEGAACELEAGTRPPLLYFPRVSAPRRGLLTFRSGAFITRELVINPA